MLRVQGKGDHYALQVLAVEHVCDDMRVRDSGHGRKAVVLGLVQVDLLPELLYCAVGALQLSPMKLPPVSASARCDNQR